MRLVLSAILTLSLAATAAAQRGGHGGGGFGGGHGGGFGGGVSRGGGFSHGGFAGGGFRGGFGGGGIFRGGFHGGFRGGFGFRRFGPRFYGYSGWPIVYGGYGLGYYGDPYWNDYSYSNVYPYSYPAMPAYYNEPYLPEPPEPQTVIIQQPPPPPAYEPPRTNGPVSYLIAFKDHNIKLALAYWTEKNDLRYVTTEHEIKTVPLSSVDRDLSLQLNRERRVTFTLPSIGG